ncbi:hypothetical protein DEA98_01940 [Brucella pseudogrignonensis]|nr:hypothetical protein [Brucella pseudogrignonensis]
MLGAMLGWLIGGNYGAVWGSSIGVIIGIVLMIIIVFRSSKPGAAKACVGKLGPSSPGFLYTRLVFFSLRSDNEASKTKKWNELSGHN